MTVSCYIPHLYIEGKVSYDISRFLSCGFRSSLPDELSLGNRDSNGFQHKACAHLAIALIIQLTHHRSP